MEIGKGALHFLGMAKMGSTRYKVEGRLLERCGINLDDVIADILRDGEAAKEILYMAKAMEEYRRAG